MNTASSVRDCLDPQVNFSCLQHLERLLQNVGVRLREMAERGRAGAAKRLELQQQVISCTWIPKPFAAVEIMKQWPCAALEVMQDTANYNMQSQ